MKGFRQFEKTVQLYIFVIECNLRRIKKWQRDLTEIDPSLIVSKTLKDILRIEKSLTLLWGRFPEIVTFIAKNLPSFVGEIGNEYWRMSTQIKIIIGECNGTLPKYPNSLYLHFRYSEMFKLAECLTKLSRDLYFCLRIIKEKESRWNIEDLIQSHTLKEKV